MFPQAQPQIDPRAALIQMMAQQQQAQHPIHAGMAHAQTVGALHQVAQALALQVARQKQPLGRARVAPNPPDAGYNGNWQQRGVSRVGFAQPMIPANQAYQMFNPS